MPLLRLRYPRALLSAEQRFFDAHCRGGDRDPRELVVPLGFFGRPDVAGALERWYRGEEGLDLDVVARAWREEVPEGDETTFHRNVAFYLSLVRPRRRSWATWTVGRPAHA